ncbi:ABC transporter ATP-binding protein [Halegenticoccus tardaugens]|uniref:ABC transporter ATP-binding protein n=1 Tax=Halegenticoccus tardaugens TaxID=2071624 RepID=UPI00100BCB61|nr:sn-glycerol-3-phosphate ABC transporter ATP-binding protein UgpC [Halegenticoccus tardaugens]
MGELVLSELSKVFDSDDGKLIAVDDLNITVRDGEFLVLVGPSGCGKSTTLRCVAGLETVTDGEITLNGESITDQKPKDRDISMVFQNYALYPHMTARENMSFGLKMSTDLSDEEIEKRVEEAATMMGIETLLKSTPSELSGGQQQRVALGRAIVREPAVFLMDEPLSNLDAKLRTTMRTELQELQQRLNVTTIYVTHDQTEAMTMGDRIAILDGGELQQIGTPLECYYSPDNQFVASFIGSPAMNFFDVELQGDKLRNESFVYSLSTKTMDQLGASNGNHLVLGIRPEDIEIADASDPRSIEMRVNVVEPLGDIKYVYFDLDDVVYTASVSSGTPISEGEQLAITFPEESVHIFDGTTGNALKNALPAESEPPTSHSSS